MRPIQGTIPDKITYVFRAPQQIATGWYEIEDKIYPDFEAHAAFPVDADSEKALATAESWASSGWRAPKGKRPPNVTVDNGPIPSITVAGLEIRAEGGRAYKVLLPYNVFPIPYVDLREDVFLDAMLHNGVGKGGHLKGPFVWGRVHSQLKLVRVGSALYDALIAAKKRNAKTTVRKKDLVIGGVYHDRKLEPYLYLGRFDADCIDEAWYSRYRYERYRDKYPLFKKIEHRNKQLWCKLGTFGKKYLEPGKPADYGAQWRSGIKDENPNTYYFELVGDKAVTDHVDTIDLGVHTGKIPDLMRGLVRKNREHRLSYLQKGNHRPDAPEDIWAYRAEFVTIRDVGEPMPETDPALLDILNKAVKETKKT